MSDRFLLYGCTGYVGREIAAMAVERGLDPVVAGRDPVGVRAVADDLGTEHRVFELDGSETMEEAVASAAAVLNCAGPFIHTAEPMVQACLRLDTHYVDITGEIPVYQSLADRDEQAKDAGVMLLPGAGFDVAATDCLALYLKQQLPSASQLILAFHSQGPAGFPPGTLKSSIEMLPYGEKVRRNGRLVSPEGSPMTREIDFGRGPMEAVRLPWGDVFTAYYSTGIPNIEDYAVLPGPMARGMALVEPLRPLFNSKLVRALLTFMIGKGSTAEERAQSRTSVWGYVEDDQGRSTQARLHGPEIGVVWTGRAALAAVERVLAGDAPPGFQTPAKAYGADFTLEVEGVTREEVA